jgi:SGNH hydrolase-like domain, acetyltransferase AlgX
MKRLLLGSVFGFAFLELFFLGLLPDFLGSRYVVLIGICVALTVAAVKPGSVLTKTSIVVASISVSILLLDLGSRPVMEPLLFGPRPLFMYSWAPMPSLWRYAPNVAFEGMLGGDLAMRDYQERRFETFETDSYGFRNTAKQATDAQRDGADLIMLGDSFGVGVGTAQNQTWASLFEQEYGLRTYNLSMAGSGPWQELMNLKIACPRLHCDSRTVVLWALFAGNDLQDPIGDELEPSVSYGWAQRMRVSARTYLNMSPVRNVIDLAINRKNQSRQPVIVRDLPSGRKLIFRSRYVRAVQLSYDQVRLHPHYPKVAAVVDEMKRFSDSEHFRVVVVMIPAKEEVYSSILSGGNEPGHEQPSGFSRAVRELCQRNGLPYLDLKPYFLEEARKQLAQSGELLWWSDDTHWNTRGHALAASIVYRYLLARLRSTYQSEAMVRRTTPGLLTQSRFEGGDLASRLTRLPAQPGSGASR